MSAQCNEIELLLGPFDDGELEPHEMEEVALHVVTCHECKAALDAYRSVGVALRSAAFEPDLAAFSASVQERIQRIRVPLNVRIRESLDRLGEGLGTVFAMGAAAAMAAVITAVLVGPYAQRFMSRAQPPAENVAAAQPAAAVPAAISPSSAPSIDVNVAASDLAADSQAIISRLESESPSVAVWSEPRTDTTVIWVPDQP